MCVRGGGGGGGGGAFTPLATPLCMGLFKELTLISKGLLLLKEYSFKLSSDENMLKPLLPVLLLATTLAMSNACMYYFYLKECYSHFKFLQWQLCPLMHKASFVETTLRW